MKVQCLMVTHGRYAQVSRAVSCFVGQDYPDKELLILNHHPHPLVCDLPGVTVWNNPNANLLGENRQALLGRATADLVRTWDDDDLYLPWSIRQGVENISSNSLWKPRRCWFKVPGKPHVLVGNATESSITFRRSYAQQVGFKKTAGDEHEWLFREGIPDTELGVQASYVYRWGHGEWHISGSQGRGTDEDRSRVWRENNQDTGSGRPIELVSLQRDWDDLLNSVQSTFPAQDFHWIRSRLL